METDISTAIAKNRPVEGWFVKKALSGILTIDDVKSYDHYDMLFKLRHDFIHWYICSHRSIPFGEKKISDVKELKILETYDHWNEIKNQTPDSIVVEGKKIHMMELTISNNRLSGKEKITKYSLLVDAMRKKGFEVDLEIIVIPTLMNIPNRESLISDHKFTDSLVNDIYRIVGQFNNIIHMIESTPIGQEWHSRRNRETYDDVDMKISNADILRYHRHSQFKCFESEEDLMSLLDHKTQENLLNPIMTDEDEKFLDFVANEASKMESDLLNNEDLDKAIGDLFQFHKEKCNSRTFRSSFPLPYMESKIIDSSIRSTDNDMRDLDELRAYLGSSLDSFLIKVGGMTSTIDQIKLSSQDRSDIALEGPGRKHYIQKCSKPHIDRQNKNKNYWFDIKADYYDKHIESLSFALSKLDIVDIKGLQFEGPGLNYVRACQSIFREICINVMRPDRRHKFCLKPTGVDGVFVLIFPGPKLRTGENISVIWFKLFCLEKAYSHKNSTHWMFKQWIRRGQFYESQWLSTDANRLDHYLRCYDRILMSYLTYSNFDRSTLEENVRNDGSNVLGIIIMIYMEDKRSTSKMLQDGRYLVMGSLSKFRWWASIMGKFEEPIRSPLQAYLLLKMIDYSTKVNKDIRAIIKKAQFGKIVGDEDIISDKFAGAYYQLPRLLTSGQDVNFNQLLCEMYFTMLFNKNQDDPTHATFQILDKMLEGEASLKQVKQTTKLHMGGNDKYKDALELIHKPHKNQFSKFAIELGSRLQSISSMNKHPSGLSHRKAAQNKFLNKPLSEFATYKSSSTLRTKVLDRTLLVEKKQVSKTQFIDVLEEEYRSYEDDSRIEMTSKQNPRRRCIEGIIELLRSGKSKSFDVIHETVFNEMYFQVFKKNQIGGAREILILPIEKRITINILESFSRLICKDDSREMLTHGDIKLSMMRDIMREVRRSSDDSKKRIVLNFNLDKTRWGPSFMPIQFIYMFKPFAQYYPSLFRFLLITLMVHTNKKCLIPERLIRVWLNDPSDDIKHMSEELQMLKEKFLKEKDGSQELFFENESNMGQGILHYTSSYLHLCALSFRDSIYLRMCKKCGITPGQWKDLVSSDDSYTALSLPLDTIKNIQMRYTLFIKAQEVTERLFNIWTSKSKSSISFLISEFNSMFGSNLTLFPTTFKFGLSSVIPSNTDSFFRMVKESYNACRQIVENGGSLELFLIAHKLNKQYCEHMYHTNTGGINNFEQHDLRREFVPFQLGVYPIGDPAMMLIMGPEIHNYWIVYRSNEMTDKEHQLFNNCHTMIKINNPDLYAEINSFDNIYTGLLRIEASIGPVKQLQRIKRQIDMSWEQMNEMLLQDILITMREPKDPMEIKLHTYLKLFSYGASEALRDTASSIYYARVAASVTANAFQIPYHEDMKSRWEYDPKRRIKRFIGHTYSDCLKYLIDTKMEFTDYTTFYPHMREFKDLYQLSKLMVDYKERSLVETQNLRSFQLSEVTMRIKNPIKDLLDTFWLNNTSDRPTSFIRDWISLKELVPLIKDSLSETLDQIPGNQHNKVKVILLLLMRIMGYSSRPMKAVTYGSSCRTYDATYLNLIQRCLHHNFTSEELVINANMESDPRIYDRLYFVNNLFNLSVYIGKPVDIFHLLDNNVVQMYMRDTMISSPSKKKILMMLLYCGYIDNINEWTNQTKTIMHQWVQRQRWDGKTYSGNFKIICQCGHNKLLLEKVNSLYNIRMSSQENPSLNYELLENCCSLTSTDIDVLLKKMRRGSFIVTAKKIISSMTRDGIWIDMQPLEDIKVISTNIYIRLEDDIRFLVLDGDEGQIMKTPFGLTATDYIPLDKKEFPEIFIDTISIFKLAKIKIFSANFNFDNVSKSDLVDTISDIQVMKPKISQVTMKRLEGLISKDWGEKTLSDEFQDADEKYTEEEIEQFEADLSNFEPDAKFIERIITEGDNIYDQVLDANELLGLFTSLPTKVAKYQPTQILERVLNCRYHMIARCCVDIRRITRKTIEHIIKITKSKFLAYSLIYVYDRMYSTTEAPSPPSHDTELDHEFLAKFGLDSEPEMVVD